MSRQPTCYEMQMAETVKPTMMASQEVAKERRLTATGGDWSGIFEKHSYAGKRVSIESSLQLSTVWACLTITSRVVGSLPIDIFYKQDDGSLVPAPNEEFGTLLGLRPNLDDTTFEFWSRSTALTLAQGNAYFKKDRFGRRITGLTPLYGCKPFRDSQNNLKFRHTENGIQKVYDREEIFQLKGFNMGGDEGLSAVRYGVQTMGTAMAQQETTGSVFRNKLQVAGLLETDKSLTSEQRERLQEIMTNYQGSDNAAKMMILESGLSYKQVMLNPVDAELLDSVKFSVEDICRWFGTPPVVIGHSSDGQTMFGAGVENVMLHWLTTGVDPILESFEQRIERFLMTPSEQRRLAVRFRREKMLRMDSKTMGDWLKSTVNSGVLTPNEGRKMLNLPNHDDGDKLYIQGAMVPLSEAQTRESDK